MSAPERLVRDERGAELGVGDLVRLVRYYPPYTTLHTSHKLAEVVRLGRSRVYVRVGDDNICPPPERPEASLARLVRKEG